MHARRLPRRTLLRGLAAATFAAPLATLAQGAPLRLVIPSAAGGPFDPLGRYVAERLGQALGQTMIVENRSGATGTIGMAEVARSAPDGRTFGLMFMPLTIVPSMFQSLPYDTLRDLAPVSQLSWTYNVLVVHPDLPAHSAKDLVELAQRQPGKLAYGSGGNGSPAHVIAEALKHATRTFILHVPYRGPAAALQDLIGGRLQLMFASLAAAIPHVRGGRLRALAVTSTQRIEALPEAPTLAEAGFPTLDVRDWWALVEQAGTPAATIQRVNAEVRRILDAPEARERFAQQGVYPQTGTPEELGRLIRSELDKWSQVVRAAGLKPD
jgi:tripartite-type tricarboxylate transporter receptor subunit TctC